MTIEIAPDGLLIYHKPTQTGQYINVSNITPWISALVHRAKTICSPNKLPMELQQIRKYISWNGFPKDVGNIIIKETLQKGRKATTGQVIGNPIPTIIYVIWYFKY